MIWRKQKREPQDPTWIFSTWPIPLWAAGRARLAVTGSDSDPAFHGAFDLIYDGPEDYPRLEQVMNRLNSTGSGTLRMTGGTFELPGPIYIGGLSQSEIVGCYFKGTHATDDV